MSPPRGNFKKTIMKIYTFSYSKLKKEGKENLSGFRFTYRIKLGSIKIFIIDFSALLKGDETQRYGGVNRKPVLHFHSPLRDFLDYFIVFVLPI